MIKLTDEDRDRISAIFAHVPDGADFSIGFQREAIYRAGLAAGIERAAKVCDSVDNYANPMTASDCAAAIRALP